MSEPQTNGDVQLPVMQQQKQNEACHKIIITGALKQLNLKNVFMHSCALYTWKQDWEW